MGKYGYISVDMLYEYAMNTVDKTVSPNEFMRMSRANVIPIEWIKSKIDAILDSYPDGNEETEILCKLLYNWEKENE